MDTQQLKDTILQELPNFILQDQYFREAVLKIITNIHSQNTATESQNMIVKLTKVVKNLEAQLLQNEQKWIENQKKWENYQEQIADITTAIQTLDQQLNPDEDEDLTIRPF
ncbi:MAG: hypothetical protein KAH84_08115 [Thiomargarita sp.]|nr:hypothetical protein [Thiomargarita sp.]